MDGIVGLFLREAALLPDLRRMLRDTLIERS